MNKTYRHGQILHVIRTHRIHTQEQLAQELQVLGVHTTQVTLSRDIRELGLVKTAPDGYVQVAAQPTGPSLATVVSEFLLHAEPAQNLLVLKTGPGNANALAIAVDRANLAEVVGTIAGDDTVLVVTPDTRAAVGLKEKLLVYLEPD